MQAYVQQHGPENTSCGHRPIVPSILSHALQLRKVGCFYEYVDEIEVKSAESLPACQRAADVWRRSGADLLRRQRFQIRGQVLRGLLPYQGTFAANAGFEEFIQALGAWGEAYVFLWLQLALPGFDEDCWVSANKRYI